MNHEVKKMNAFNFESNPVLNAVEVNPIIQSFYQENLLSLINDFTSRPSKGLRFELLNLGFEIALEKITQKLELGACLDKLNFFNLVIECLHSASLIVDDIQDQSSERRGEKTLHKIYGVPLALNAGNWLYFYPLYLIEQTSILSSNLKQMAIRECNKTLFLAHFGQALDLGVLIQYLPQSQVKELVNKTIEHKTGNLTSLSMILGALIVCDQFKMNKDETDLICKFVGELGMQYGKFLQMNDDLGNLISKNNPSKRFEDLRMLRPTFVWAAASITFDKELYNQLLNQVQTATTAEELEEITLRFNLLDHGRNQLRAEMNEWKEVIYKEYSFLSESIKNKILKSLQRLEDVY